MQRSSEMAVAKEDAACGPCGSVPRAEAPARCEPQPITLGGFCDVPAMPFPEDAVGELETPHS